MSRKPDVNPKKMISFTIDESNLNDFIFLYSRDVLTTFVRNSIFKAIKRRDFLEFVIFDNVDDFKSTRSVLLENKR